MNRIFIPLLLVILIGVSSCEYEPIIEPEVDLPDTVSFTLNIEPIFIEQACVGCHKDGFKPVLTAGDAYASLMSDPAYVNTDDPEVSTIYSKPSPDGGHPKKYTRSQSELVLQWIKEGAKNN